MGRIDNQIEDILQTSKSIKCIKESPQSKQQMTNYLINDQNEKNKK